jgi:hypothetical protein
MKDFEDVKAAASVANLSSAFDDASSSKTSESQILSQISNAFNSDRPRTKAELLLWQKQNHRKET